MTTGTWRKSSFSGSQAECVEVGGDNGGIMVRDTQNREGQTLSVGAGAWLRFTAKIKG